jgi:hypothetical protein
MIGKRTTALLLSVLIFVSPLFGETRRRCVSPSTAKKIVERQHRDKNQSVRTALAQASQVGNIVVLQADPEVLILSNEFDLHNRTVRFRPVSKGRYAYTLELSSFDGQASQTVELGDDASHELVFKNFQFPFGRKTYDRCYVNSNGSITFETPDSDPPAMDAISQSLPRIAGFFTDLNPENAGTILIHQTSERVLISWLRVPEFFNQNQFDFGQNTFQIVLYRTGVIDIVFTEEFTAAQGFVGLIPGFDTIPIRFVDFSTLKATGRQLHSFVENFHDYVSIDLPDLMKSLYVTQPDRFDFVSLFSNFDLTPVPGAQAFALNVRNNVEGIGDPSDRNKPIFNDNEKYGSSGRLQNITFLGNLHQYPLDPSGQLPEGDVSLLDILAHEVGHRWLSYIKVSRDGNDSDVILGRDKSHWSFFLDSQGSFLEGNQILPRGANSFETGNPYQRYSDLDLYLMGLKRPEEVRDTFYVDGPTNFTPDFPFSPEAGPESNVKFKGNPIPVTIEDIIAVNGPRRPSARGAQTNFRHLFVLITKSDKPATPEEIAYLETVRSLWAEYFNTATGGVATIDTVLSQ